MSQCQPNIPAILSSTERTIRVAVARFQLRHRRRFSLNHLIQQLSEEKPMITNCLAFVKRILNDQRGQVLPWVTGGMFAFLGMAGLTIDVGHAYVVRAALQNGTNAAALAAASNVYTTQSAIVTAADNYASSSGEANYVPGVIGMRSE